ncbi:Pkinase domain-containing protein/LRR_1 domain-containing protein, partial [Cephalotus follicularis]
LQALRTISIINNSFSGPIPEFNRLGALKAIYLSENQFTGEIPSDYFTKMESLKKVFLSDNKFTGNIPSSLFQLPHLLELHIENNQFSGAIPSFKQPSLKSLNMSNNKLEGEIPDSLSKFDATSFEGNAGLCGDKLGKACKNPDPAPAVTPVASNNDNDVKITDDSKKILAALITLCVLLSSLAIILMVKFRRKKEDFDVLGKEGPDEVVEVQVSVPPRKQMELSRKTAGSGRRTSNHGKEVLGNGSLGSSYKAMMANGVAVVVKRMREMNALGRDAFDAEIRRLGMLKHSNILPLLAYHYRKEEKLLIYEYIPKGSLLYLLHGHDTFSGDRGPSHAELDWPARLKIVQGIAKGLGYLHTELASISLPHGNIKSCNVFLGSENDPLIADYGFSPFINSGNAANAAPPLFAYKAPEAAQYGQVSPKCDVYCLGIVILEILTGKFPSQYLSTGKGGTDVIQWVASAISEKRETELLDPEIASSLNSIGEMKKLLHIGAACTESNPELRLDMREAITRIEDIKLEGSQEDRTIQELPSLRDGYADAPQNTNNVSSFAERYGQQSARRLASGSIDGISGRRDGDDFAFGIS